MDPEWTQVSDNKENTMVENTMTDDDKAVINPVKINLKELHQKKFNDLVNIIIVKCNKEFAKGKLTCFVDFSNLAERSYISCMSLHICSAVYERLETPFVHCVIFQHMMGVRLDVRRILDMKLSESATNLNVDWQRTMMFEVDCYHKGSDKVHLIMDIFNQNLQSRKSMTVTFAKCIVNKIQEFNSQIEDHKSLTKKQKISWILLNMTWKADIQIMYKYIECGKFE